MRLFFPALILPLALVVSGCATESSGTVQALQTRASQSAPAYNGAKIPVSVGRFDNRSGFLQGVFSDGVDRLGSQAQTILVTHLQQSGRFRMLDRANMSALKTEAGLRGKKQKLKGARFVITGDVTEYGRRETGDHQLFGILGRGKTQTAYAKVMLNVVSVDTSEVIYSVQGAGEYNLSNREIIGFGGTAGYDSTLSGKVLDLAVREAVDHLIEGLQTGAWKVE